MYSRGKERRSRKALQPMEMRAASNAQLRVTGVSFIPAWWCNRVGLSDWLDLQVD